MYYNELLTKLTHLTKRNNITNAEIGKAINLDRQAMSGRALRNSRFKDFEIEAVEKYFCIDFSKITIYENTFERQNDVLIPEKTSKFGKRLALLQEKSGLSDTEFSELLDIEEDEYREENEK